MILFFAWLLLLWSPPSYGSDLEVRIRGVDHPVGYCARLSEGSAVSAAHVFTIPRRLNQGVEFDLGSDPCRDVLICAEADLCFIEFEDHGLGVDLELGDPHESMLMRDRPIRLRSSDKGDVVVDWEEWMERGMSGSGLYTQDGRLVAVLSRIKHGHYAVGTMVSPFVE